MKETLVKLLTAAVSDLQTSGTIDASAQINVRIDRTKNPEHGDYASNLALTLAKHAQMPPRELAELLAAKIADAPVIAKAEVAGPGFINFFLKAEDKYSVVRTILDQKDSYGQCDIGQGTKILLEFVSANPTGPLHVGHGRSAAFGGTLANLLRVAGYTVDCEYYVNDSGRQMDILALSVWLRYLSCCGENITFPDNCYKGDYVRDIAKVFYDEVGDKFRHAWSAVTADLDATLDSEAEVDKLISSAKQLLSDNGFATVHNLALTTVLNGIKEDLSAFGVDFTNWFSERSLVADNSIQLALEDLHARGYTYEQDNALWFKATAFGDEKDRVLIRANGQYTYFAPDIAYHWRKYQRGYDKIVDIFGADHHGYLPRIQASMQALGHNESDMAFVIVQFANLYRDNQRVQMSTRSGSFVTLSELQAEVGRDAARFFYVLRKPEQHMDFDLDLAKSESNDNPVYYIQYAHARIASVERQMVARNLTPDFALGLENLNLLTSAEELQLLKLLANYPEVIRLAAQSYEPHSVAFYLRELATALHSYYNSVQLICEDEKLRASRACLLRAIRQVVRNGLTLLGVSCPESM